MSVLGGVIRSVAAFLGVWGDVGGKSASVDEFGGVVVLSEGGVGGR